MSRETDSSSSGPQGRGGSSYPPGTEPYGTAGQTGSPGADGDADTKSRSDERKTETRLTTRIRINIPGSRPIPPVVMRSSVGDDVPLPASDRERDRPEGAPRAAPPAPRDSEPEAAPGGAGSGPEASEWFVPRKGVSGASSAATAATDAETHGRAESPYSSESRPGGLSSDDPFGIGTGAAAGRPGAASGAPASPGLADFDKPASSPGLADFDAPAPSAAGSAPSGPTTGPALGDLNLSGPSVDDAPAAAHRGVGPGFGPEPITPGAAAGRPPGHPGPSVSPGFDVAVPTGVDARGGPGSTGPAGPPAPPAGPERVAGDTLVSGIPRVPATEAAARSTTSGSATSDDDFGAFEDDDSGSNGRSKLLLAGGAVLGVVAVLYGVGLLLDHADVPNGTEVLGVDIGGTSRHEAIAKLDKAVGDSPTKPFTIVSQGQRTQLKPAVAGLTLDTEETVRAAAGRDYNPVSVIGSLFGSERLAEAAIKVDEEKMDAALTAVSRKTGDGGSPRDGMVKFVRGKAVAVPGTPHKGIDPDDASAALKKAYRERAASGENRPVELPVSMQQPKVGKQEIARAISQFGKTAMSGMVTVKAGDASIKFSPAKSIPKFLAMKPVNGTLVDTYDLAALEELYGTTFEGIEVARGNGTKTPVMPQDVAGALRVALKQTDPAERVQEIPLNAR